MVHLLASLRNLAIVRGCGTRRATAESWRPPCGMLEVAASRRAAGEEVARRMAKRKRSGARGSGPARARGGGAGGGNGRAATPSNPVRTIGLDPSWFAFRGRDTRGTVVQLAAVAGLAVGLFVALDRYGSSKLGGSEQVTQLAWLASIVGLAALPVAAAAGSDAAVTWMARRGAISATTLERLALVVAPIVALVTGAVLPLLLFAVGGQSLYLVVAGIILVVVVAAVGSGYVRRWYATAGDSPGHPGGGA
jgi:hypothetical protein